MLEALEEIRMLTHRYGLALDRFDAAGAAGAFTEDAVFDMSAFGLPLLEGRDALREFFGHTVTTMASQMHLTASHVIDFDGPDEAHGTNYLFEDGYTHEGRRIHVLAINEDSYVRTTEGWRISHRVTSPLVPPQLEGF